MPNYVEIAVVHGYKTNICQIMFLCSVLHEIDKVCCIKLEQVVGGINLIIHIKNSKLHNNGTHLSNNIEQTLMNMNAGRPVRRVFILN